MVDIDPNVQLAINNSFDSKLNEFKNDLFKSIKSMLLEELAPIKSKFNEYDLQMLQHSKTICEQSEKMKEHREAIIRRQNFTLGLAALFISFIAAANTVVTFGKGIIYSIARGLTGSL